MYWVIRFRTLFLDTMAASRMLGNTFGNKQAVCVWCFEFAEGPGDLIV